MTAARQERKSRRLAAISAAILGALMAAGAGLAPIGSTAATTERVVANRHTGLAIDGFDPVAYFVDGAPRIGHAGLEFRHAGASWRFLNEGNRAAFAAAPDVYMPRFGGYDPVAVARGTATAGHPRLWAIVDKRLYLFHSAEAQAAFNANAASAIEAANRHWPEVLDSLSP
jgi:hypothetical protein